ncbi:unnamed protein product [Leuciscus chuanchicus]
MRILRHNDSLDTRDRMCKLSIPASFFSSIPINNHVLRSIFNKLVSYVCCARDISPRLSNGASCRLPPGGASGVCAVSEGYHDDTLPLLKKLDHSSLSYRFSLPRPPSLY